MAITKELIVKKIKEIYPELGAHSVELLVSQEEGGGWDVTMKMGEAELTTHIEKHDAEKCLAGEQCVHMGVQVGRFIENYCLGGKACPV